MAAYYVVELEVQDPAAFEEYRRQVPALIEKYGGRYLVRGGKTETLEGDWRPQRVVVLEFPSVADAKRFYEAPEYAPLKALRLRTTRSKTILVEGV
jgi:uncharacterized protein (DUF1330 family)